MSNPKSSRVSNIDSLRCFAMTAVIAEHCKILPFGWMGVWLFYVISGFVVTKSISALNAPAPGGKIAEFYGKRAARILPPYLLYVASGVLWTAISSGAFDGRAVSSLLLFYNNLEASLGQGGMSHWPVGHLWTISVEMQFYAVFGALLIFLPRRQLIWVLASTLVLAPLGRFWLSHLLGSQGFESGNAAYIIYSAPLLHSDSFSLGALVALAPVFFKRGKTRFALAAAAAVTAAFYILLQIVLNSRDSAHGVDVLRNVISGNLYGHFQEVFVYSVVALFSVNLLLIALDGLGLAGRILAARPLQFIGERSYGGYLYHALVLALLEPLIAGTMPSAGGGMMATLSRGALLFVCAYPIIVALSALSYSVYERPVIRAAVQRLRSLVAARSQGKASF